MTRSLFCLAATLLLGSTAIAGPISADRQLAARAPAQRYIVSANLNKLVFWHLPERGEGKAQR